MSDFNQSASNNRTCLQYQVEGRTSRLLFRYAFPIILVASVGGNVANVILYRHKFLKSSPTVRMLTAKAICNMLFCCSMIPNFMFAWHLDIDSAQPSATATVGDRISAFYWFSLKYVLFTSNVLSTAAIWLTVAVTAEHFVIVTFPVRGKILSNTKNAHLTIFMVFPGAICLHVFNLIARETITKECNQKFMVIYLFRAVNHTRLYSSIYSMANTMLMYIVPMISLIFFCAAIYHKLFMQGNRFQTNTEQKQCVTRLALATTVCHMLFEMPFVVINTLVMAYGTMFHSFPYQEQISAVANVLSLVNSSIPFFVYLSCSQRFRQLAILLFCRRCIQLTEQDVDLLLEHSNAIRANGEKRLSLSATAQKRYSIITQGPQL